MHIGFVLDANKYEDRFVKTKTNPVHSCSHIEGLAKEYVYCPFCAKRCEITKNTTYHPINSNFEPIPGYSANTWEFMFRGIVIMKMVDKIFVVKDVAVVTKEVVKTDWKGVYSCTVLGYAEAAHALTQFVLSLGINVSIDGVVELRWKTYD